MSAISFAGASNHFPKSSSAWAVSSRLKGLIIVAPFLPSPLIEKLGSEGFASKVERGSGADWMVYFWREVG